MTGFYYDRGVGARGCTGSVCRSILDLVLLRRSMIVGSRRRFST